jgi:polyphosphate kinase
MAIGSQRAGERSSARRGKHAAGRKSADARYINRELSWLDFNVRVLALAQDKASPLLERAKFLAIVSSNLDEFFQVRVAGLKEQVVAGVTTRSPDGMTAAAQLAAIRKRVGKLMAHMQAVFNGDIAPGLAEVRIRIVRMSDLSSADRAWVKDLFERQIFPVLTPLAVDPPHPIPNNPKHSRKQPHSPTSPTCR